MTKHPRCNAQIYKRDTLRYTGRVKGGFEMHYRKDQCSRRATKDGRCWQHPKEYGFVDCPWAKEFVDE